MSDSTLVLDNVHVSYGNKHQRNHVLNGFSLHIDAGEIGCLLGASGCGKTTALRAIAGFEQVEQGTIYVGAAVLLVQIFTCHLNSVMSAWFSKIMPCFLI